MTGLEQKKLSQQIAESMALTAKLQAEIGKISFENEKLNAETGKIKKEKDWYIALVASTATLAIVAVVKLFL